MILFLQKSAGGIHNHMDEQIQFLGPCVHHDVLAMLNSGCELFRRGLGNQLSRLKDVQGKLDEWGASISKCRGWGLIQTSERDDT